MRHLILYDGECGLCDRTVQWVLRNDSKEFFAFAPLAGATAQKFLKFLPEGSDPFGGVLLIEDFTDSTAKALIGGRAVFRICWILGGRWRLIGWLAYLPTWLYDWGYRWIAKRRHSLFPMSCTLPKEEQRHRFL